MSRQIQAQRTKRIISFARNLLDKGYEIFTTEDEILEQANIAQDEIARETYCLTTPDIITELVPDRWEYELIKTVDTAMSILRIDRVSILDTAGAETFLRKRTLTYIDTARLGTEYTKPAMYDFDGKRLFIWKPYSTAGYRIKIRCARFPLQAELIGYDSDPCIDYSYDIPLMHGTVAKLIFSRKDLMEKHNVEYYFSEYKKYKNVYTRRKTSESNVHDSNTYNLQ